MYKNKNLSMKAVVLLLAVTLMIGCVAGGTLAYLMTNSSAVTNTFVVGDIGELKLYENGDEITTDTTNSFTIIPGKDITKDVTVSYSYTDEDDYSEVPVYVFLKIDAENWAVAANNTTYTVAEENKNLLSWNIDKDWTFLTQETDGARVYWRTVEAGGSLERVPVIKELTGTGNTGHIEVSSEITKDNIEKVANDAGNITFTAYAIQQDTFDNADAAWTVAKEAK